jgi:putative oxidoreductase
MVVAFLTTKIPVILGHDWLGFKVRPLARYGFLSMLHEARTDLSMALGSLFLFVVGAGPWSLDAWLDGTEAARRSGRRGGAAAP